jgi:hypothetical protein
MKPELVFVLTSSLLVGCATFSVHKKASNQTESLKGVPFYTKTAGCRHEVVYAEPRYRVTLERITISIPDPPPSPSGTMPAEPRERIDRVGSLELSRLQYRGSEFDKLVVELNRIDQKPEKIEEAWSALVSAVSTPAARTTQAGDRVLATNRNVQTAFVDYPETHYLNAKRPWIGSVTASAELGPDGTLSKSSVTIEDKTVQAFLDLLPVKEILTGLATKKLGLGEEALGIMAVTPATVTGRYRLTVTTRTIRHTYSKEARATVLPCPALREPGDLGDYNYLAEESPASPPSKEEDPEIKFSGQVNLPKEKPKKD